MGCVYKIINKVNNKVYIGKTISNYRVRFRSHKYEAKKYKGKKSYLHRAMLKYGFENFHIEILEERDNDTELLKLESEYILIYNSNNSEYGYNLLSSGSAYNSNSKKTDLTLFSHNNGKKSTGRLLSGKYVGVSKNGTGWSSIITRDNITYNLGVFDNETDAAIAYDIKSLELNSKTTALNFPHLLDRYQSNSIIVSPREKRQKGKVRLYKRGLKWVVVYVINNNRSIKRSFNNEKQAKNMYKEWLKLETPPEKFDNTKTFWTKNLKKKNASSIFKGVTFSKKMKKWQVTVTNNKKNIWLGYFKDEIEAAKARDNYIISNNLDFDLNFS